MERARRDLATALLLELVGLGAIGSLVALAVFPDLLSAAAMRFVVLLLLAATYGIGHGTWLLVDARRRFALADRMRRPPTARVVQRARPGA